MLKRIIEQHIIPDDIVIRRQSFQNFLGFLSSLSRMSDLSLSPPFLFTVLMRFSDRALYTVTLHIARNRYRYRGRGETSLIRARRTRTQHSHAAPLPLLCRCAYVNVTGRLCAVRLARLSDEIRIAGRCCARTPDTSPVAVHLDDKTGRPNR